MEQSVELPVPQMLEQLVDEPKIVVELTVSSGEAGSSGPRERNTTDAAATAGSKYLLVKHGLLGSHSTVPRQNPKSKCLLVELGLLGLEQTTQLALAMQQLQKLSAPWDRRAECHDRFRFRSVLAKSTPSAGFTAVAMLAGEARPLGTARWNEHVSPNWHGFILGRRREGAMLAQRCMGWPMATSHLNSLTDMSMPSRAQREKRWRRQMNKCFRKFHGWSRGHETRWFFFRDTMVSSLSK